MDKRELTLEGFLALQSEEELERTCSFFQAGMGEDWTRKEMAQELADLFRSVPDILGEVIPFEGLHFLSELFEKGCVMENDPRTSPVVTENEEDFLEAMEDLEDIGLIDIEMDPDTGVPLRLTASCELKAVMAPLLTEEMMEEARTLDRMAYLVRGMLYYYGVVEIGRLLRMLRVYLPGFSEELFEDLLNVRSNLRPYVRIEMVMGEIQVFREEEVLSFLDEESEMEEMVGMVEAASDLEYKTFSPGELLQAAQDDYLENRDGYARVRAKMKPYFVNMPWQSREGPALSDIEREAAMEEELDLLLGAMTGSIRSTGNVAYALEEIDRFSVFPTEEARKEVHEEFLFYTDNLSRIALRGHTPNEARNLRSAGKAKVLPFRKTRKIGRNDPCPCGSGKKYKNCHGSRKDPED